MSLTAERTTVVGSFAPATNREAVEAAASVPASAPAVEVRLDALSEPPALPALRDAFSGKLLLATLRSAREGGAFAGGEEARVSLLAEALRAGFDLVDVELSSPGGRGLHGFPPDRCVASFHDPSGVPRDLAGIARELAATGAAFRKLVVTAGSSADALAVLTLQRESTDGRLSAFAMGEPGIATRVLSPYLGAPIAFGSFVPGRATAPGQLSVLDLSEVYGIGRRRPVDGLLALFGGLVSHSFSPALHNGWLESAGSALLYVPFALRSLVRELGPLASGLWDLGLPLSGASVTIPFKEEATLVALFGEGSVANTLLREGEAFRAANTDQPALRGLLPAASPGAAALVLGAGGTARNAVEALLFRGYEVDVLARNPERAAELAAEAGARAVAAPRAAGAYAVVVNATPLGLRPGDALPLPDGFLSEGLLVVDAPYRPGGTELVRRARLRGASTVDGFALLAAQAALQATLFTNRPCSARDLVERLPARLRRDFEVTT